MTSVRSTRASAGGILFLPLRPEIRETPAAVQVDARPPAGGVLRRPPNCETPSRARTAANILAARQGPSRPPRHSRNRVHRSEKSRPAHILETARSLPPAD